MVRTISSANSLISELKMRGRTNAKIWSLLQWDWPVAQSIIERLYAFMTLRDEPHDCELVFTIVEQSLLQYSRSVFESPYVKYEDAARISAFLDKVLSLTTESIAATDERRHEQYWAVRFYGDKLGWCNASDPDALSDETQIREALYEMVACDELKTVLRRSDREEALLVGCMDTVY